MATAADLTSLVFADLARCPAEAESIEPPSIGSSFPLRYSGPNDCPEQGCLSEFSYSRCTTWLSPGQ